MATAQQQWPVLGPEERKLLLAALNSNRAAGKASGSSPPSKPPNPTASVNPAALDTSLLDSSNGLDFEDSSFADFPTGDNTFDLGFDANESLNDFSDLSPPDADADADNDFGEKRKSPGDDEDHGDLKRRDSDEKQVKKPGRKPLTSEPTTKRKAQNRAAQRAFRERKEKHLKDLEQKVLDLEKASESANHENGLLRAQVERLADELKAYRRRISLGAGASGPSPPHTAAAPSSAFDFDFPRFGALPEVRFPGPGSKNPSNSASPASMSSSRQNTGSTAPYQPANIIPDAANGIFADSFFDAIDRREFGSVGTSGTNTASPDPLFDFTNTSHNSSTSRSMSQSTASKATSPSVSSMSHKDPSSSCGTSPESSSQSPNIQKDKEPQTQTHSVYRNGFIEERSIPAPNPATDFNFDWLASQNGGQFDPVLFGDYRDSQAAVVGDGDFTSGFFDDSMPFPDLSDPFNFDTSSPTAAPAPAPAKPSLMEQVAASREGNDEEDAKKLHERCNAKNNNTDDKAMMTAHKIWNQLQHCPKFVSGDFDIDSLCTELSSKATCTESGVAVPKQAVEDALWRLVGADKTQSIPAARNL